MKKKLIVIISLLAILITSLLVFFNYKATSTTSVNLVNSLVTNQKRTESEFDIEGYTIDNPNVIKDPYKASPLTALVLFETDSAETVTVTIEGKDALTTYTNTFDATKQHYVPIYGLYPNYNNTVILKVGNKTKKINIKTDKLLDDFILPTSVTADKSSLNNDLYFYTPSSKGYTCAYDVNGDVRWYLSNYALWDISRLKNGHLLLSTERLINAPYYMTGLYEMDMLGKIYHEYSLKGGYHHDYYELPNGNLLIGSDDFYNDSGTVEDYIVELDRNTGNIVKTFDLKNIIPTSDTGNENYIEYDWFHNNAIWYDEKTNSITLSGRHQDAVINIDYNSGSLNWILGDPTNWDSEYQKYFFKPIGSNFEWQYSQHAAMITPEGYVFLFDNGNNKSKDSNKYVNASSSYSRGVMYQIDTDNMTIKQVYEYGKERGSSFYSPYISDVDYLAKNHYIISSGGISYKNGVVQNNPAGLTGADKLVSDTVELLNDKTVFELVLPTNTYRVEKMSLYSEKSYSIERATRLGSLGVTKPTKTKLDVITSSSSIDDTYNAHNIKITKQEDRLVFTGTFKRGSDVNIILYRNLISKVYNVRISTRPYTALCVDVFSDEENESGKTITKYINDEGLNGTYSIYVSIEGKLYNTGKNVEF